MSRGLFSCTFRPRRLDRNISEPVPLAGHRRSERGVSAHDQLVGSNRNMVVCRGPWAGQGRGFSIVVCCLLFVVCCLFVCLFVVCHTYEVVTMFNDLPSNCTYSIFLPARRGSRIMYIENTAFLRCLALPRRSEPPYPSLAHGFRACPQHHQQSARITSSID